MLVLVWNKCIFGISDYAFSLGDDGIVNYVSGVQFLHIFIMYVGLCPAGSEGAVFAILTSFGKVALNRGTALGTLFAEIWDVSKYAVISNGLSGMWKLALLTSAIYLFYCYACYLLPNSYAEQKQLKAEGEKNIIAGVVFLAVLLLPELRIILSRFSRLILRYIGCSSGGCSVR